MELCDAVDELDGEMALLQGHVDRYTDDVEALQESSDAMRADAIETAVYDGLPANIATVADSFETAYEELAVAVGTWGKERRDQRSVDLTDADTADVDAYPERMPSYAVAFVETVRSALGELFNRNVQIEDSVPDVEPTYDDRTARRLDNLAEQFEEMMADISEYESYVDDRFGTTVTEQVEATYGPVTGLTYDQ